MTFSIDTGNDPYIPLAKSASVDEGQSISLSNGQRAERLHRQIIENIEACDSIEILEEYLAAEDLLLDAFYMDRPEYWAIIDDVKDTQFACLSAGEKRSANADTDPAEPGNSLGIIF